MNSFYQAMAEYVEAEALAVLAEEFEVRTAVVINEENILTVVATLNNVVRLTTLPSLAMGSRALLHLTVRPIHRRLQRLEGA